uniref:Chromo domain-containing protein n=1 Tax=Denticeps clupeoides TaxID=299321 RepID=A0AAY4DTV2_9TELE
VCRGAKRHEAGMGLVLYRVRWKNYTSDDDTWEPEANLEDCKEVLLAYRKALAENKPKKESGLKLPTKSEIFDADSESDSDPNRPREVPVKKKKKKKKQQEEEEEEEDVSVKERKKKKKKEKWKEDKPLPAPETDEEDTRVPSPLPQQRKDKTLDSKKRLKSDDEESPVAPKKHKKDKTRGEGKQKKDSTQDIKYKKKKVIKGLESSEDEDAVSEVTTESHTDDTATAETNAEQQMRTSSGKAVEKPQQKPEGADATRAKHKKGKSDLKLQGFKDLLQEKKSKKSEVSTPPLKESSLGKLKGLTGAKSKASRSEEEPDSSDPVQKSKSKGKGQEVTSAPQKLPQVSPSSSSAPAPASKSKEEEPKEEGGDKSRSTNLFEKFLLNCEAKDRVPRRQPAAGSGDKKGKPMKESPARRPEPEKPEKNKEGEDDKLFKSVSLRAECQIRNDSARERKERLEEEERKRKERIEEAQKERKERMEEAQRARQRLAEETRLDRERRASSEAMASPDSLEDAGRWKDRRRKRQDSESRLFISCEDNQDSLERPEKMPDRGQSSLNLGGVDLKLNWMTLEDFQKHLNGEDEILCPKPLSPSELREAVKTGDYLAVKLALSSKEEYNLDQEDSSGMSLLMLAAAGGQDDILRLLIKKGVRVNGRQKNGTTALMHAADKNFLTTVAILLEAGSLVNAQTQSGETALMKACKKGNADVVHLLLEYGADCNILSKHKNTAMYFAKICNNVALYDLIKDHINTLSTVAEETIRAFFETRLTVLEPVFPLACHRLCEGPDFSLEFSYKPPAHNLEGSGILLFIFHANFLTEITARLYGPCSVHAVILNDNFQLPIFLDSHFIYSFNPVLGINKLFIRLAEAPTAKVKLLICAYRVQLQ